MKRKPSSWASSATQEFNGTLILPLNIPQVTGSTRQCIRTNKAELWVYAHANNSQVLPTALDLSQWLHSVCAYQIMDVFLSFHHLHLFPGFKSGFLILLGRVGCSHQWLLDGQIEQIKHTCSQWRFRLHQENRNVASFLRWPVGSECSMWIKIGIFCLAPYQHIKILQLFFLVIVKCQFWNVFNSNRYDLSAEIITTSQEVTFVFLALRICFAGVFVPWLCTTFNFET